MQVVEFREMWSKEADSTDLNFSTYYNSFSRIPPMLRLTLMGLVCCLAFGTTNLNAQEKAISPTSAILNADGELVGKAFAKVDGNDQPIEAKITLTKDGVVVKSVYAKEDGSFAFPSVEPGVYNMYGSAASYVGAAAVTVAPATQSCGCQPVNLGLNTCSANSYSTFSSAPASACGGGCGGGRLFGGFGGGGFGGGGLFSGGGGFGSGFGGGGLLGGSSRLLRLGAIGGIVAIAVSSPDN